MNIFVLDHNPKAAAESLHDPHVVKMILESAQLLSTAHHKRSRGLNAPLPPVLFKPTHANHPCALWARESEENYSWLFTHLTALCIEYSLRFKKTHSVELSGLRGTLRVPPQGPWPARGLTPFALAMPEEFKTACPVESYRNYYKTTKGFTKSGKFMARYRSPAKPPAWWPEHQDLQQRNAGEAREQRNER